MTQRKNPKEGEAILAPVDTYEERPLEARSPEETAMAEARVQTDQIADYHQQHPTLDASGDVYDPDVQQALRTKAVAPIVREAKENAEQPQYQPPGVDEEG